MRLRDEFSPLFHLCRWVLGTFFLAMDKCEQRHTCCILGSGRGLNAGQTEVYMRPHVHG